MFSRSVLLFSAAQLSGCTNLFFTHPSGLVEKVACLKDTWSRWDIGKEFVFGVLRQVSPPHPPKHLYFIYGRNTIITSARCSKLERSEEKGPQGQMLPFTIIMNIS